MQRKLFFFLSLSISILFLIGCGGATSSSDANLQVLLTDAPADDASELNVTFGAVRLVPAGDENAEAGIVTVSETGGSFDVLELRNGETELLGEAAVPNGSYTQLRLIVEEASITVDGETSPVTIPSGAQSGLKINIEPPLTAAAGQSSTIILDFNARRVIQTGNGAYKMGPTAIRATSVSGTLEGRLVDSEGNGLAGALVSVSQNGETVTDTVSDEDGNFKIITLTEGSYEVTVALEGYETQTFSNVAITANTNVGLTGDGTVTLSPLP